METRTIKATAQRTEAAELHWNLSTILPIRGLTLVLLDEPSTLNRMQFRNLPERTQRKLVQFYVKKGIIA